MNQVHIISAIVLLLLVPAAHAQEPQGNAKDLPGAAQFPGIMMGEAEIDPDTNPNQVGKYLQFKNPSNQALYKKAEVIQQRKLDCNNYGDSSYGSCTITKAEEATLEKAQPLIDLMKTAQTHLAKLNAEKHRLSLDQDTVNLGRSATTDAQNKVQNFEKEHPVRSLITNCTDISLFLHAGKYTDLGTLKSVQATYASTTQSTQVKVKTLEADVNTDQSQLDKDNSLAGIVMVNPSVGTAK